MPRIVSVVLFVVVFASANAFGFDFFFAPDTSFGALGDTILLSGRVGPTDTLRSFTIYIYNDTTQLDLVPPVTVGSLLAGRAGLQFDYFDHPPNAPHRLEIGAAIFGTDFWAGPGELFQLRFRLLTCTDAAPPADVGFRRPDGTFVPGVYNAPLIVICDRVPLAPGFLTIYPTPPGNATLYWSAVHFDTLGFPLHSAVSYAIYRQQIQPVLLPPDFVGTVADTFYVDPLNAAVENVYHVVAEVSP